MDRFTSGRRGTALAAAVALALVGGLLLLGYVRGLEQRALADAEPVEVLVAKERIPAGTPAEEAARRGLIAPKTVPRTAAVDGVVSDLASLEGRAATADVLPGEQIVSGRFSSEGAPGVLPIPEGHHAITVEVGRPPAVAGFVRPGDRVAVLARVEPGDGDAQVRFLLQDVGVLAVGDRVMDRAPEQDAPQEEERVLLTLAVRPEQAEQVGYAVLSGQVYFTLLGSDQTTAATPGRTAGNLFG